MAQPLKKVDKPEITKIIPPMQFKEGYLDSNVGIPIEVRRSNGTFRTVERALEKSRGIVEQVERVRKADLKREHLTEIGRRAETFKFWKSKYPELLEMAGRASDAVKHEAERIEKEIINGIRRTARDNQLQARLILQEIPPADRVPHVRSLIQNAVDEEDREILEIILGSSNHFIGIPKEGQQHLRRMFSEKYYADEIAQRDALLKAGEIVTSGFEAASKSISKELNDPEVRRSIELESRAQKAREN